MNYERRVKCKYCGEVMWKKDGRKMVYGYCCSSCYKQLLSDFGLRQT